MRVFLLFDIENLVEYSMRW